MHAVCAGGFHVRHLHKYSSASPSGGGGCVDPGDEECGNVIKRGEEVASKSDEAEGGWW